MFIKKETIVSKVAERFESSKKFKKKIMKILKRKDRQ